MAAHRSGRSPRGAAGLGRRLGRGLGLGLGPRRGRGWGRDTGRGRGAGRGSGRGSGRQVQVQLAVQRVALPLADDPRRTPRPCTPHDYSTQSLTLRAAQSAGLTQILGVVGARPPQPQRVVVGRRHQHVVVHRVPGHTVHAARVTRHHRYRLLARYVPDIHLGTRALYNHLLIHQTNNNLLKKSITNSHSTYDL